MSTPGHSLQSIVDRVLSHWFGALVILLAVAALATYRSDMYPPSTDEYYSMHNSGWTEGAAFSPAEVLQYLRRNSPNHSPLYFLLLSLWGQLTVPDIMLARLLSIMFSLLGLSLIYRLARDYVGPAAGIFALLLACGNAFYNYYFMYARMYSLLVLLSALVLWIYLRIARKQALATGRHYLALGAAVYCLANTFLFSATFLLMLGIYHCIRFARNRTWLKTSLTVIVALALFSPWLLTVFADAMRHHLSGWVPLLLTIVAGLYALYRVHWFLSSLVLLWLLAGLQFQHSAPWEAILGGHILSYRREPFHLVSREALQAEFQPLLVAYKSDSRGLYWKYKINDESLGALYFDRRNLRLLTPSAIEQLEKDVRFHAIEEPYVWVFYRDGLVSTADRQELATVMYWLNYELCESRAVGFGSTLDRFSWDVLDCAPPKLQSRHQNEIIQYQFFGAEVNPDTDRLAFVDRWASGDATALSDFNMSLQLLAEDWNNVAQVDLPMVKPGQLRQFTIDIANVPPARYRLMAIVYNSQTGERLTWLNNSGDVPEVLALAEVNVP